LDAAVDAVQSDLSFRRNCSGQHAEGKRLDNALASLCRFIGVHGRSGITERLAVPEATRLKIITDEKKELFNDRGV
jgi:hypothetical protein